MRDVFKERKADKSVPQKITRKLSIMRVVGEAGEKYMKSCMQIFWFYLELNIET